MKTLKRSALFAMVLGVVSLAQPAHAFEALELSGQYSSAVGTQGQNFNSNLGVAVAAYFDRLIDPAIPNFISVGYNSFTLKADGTSAFRVIPILAGIEFMGKVFSDFNTTFGIAAGGAVGYISTQNAGSNMNASGYFAAQIKPGFNWVLGDGFALVGRTPVNFLVGKSSMTYLTYDLGVQFKL